MERTDHDIRLLAAFEDITDPATAGDVSTLLHALAGHTVALLALEAAVVVLARPKGHPVSAVASSQPDDLPTLAGIDWISSPGPACCPPETEGIAYDLGAPATMNRWPEFTGQATRLGLEHMRAIPLPHRHRLTGALLLFHSGVRELTPANLRLAQSLALTTASALLKECDTQSLERRNAQLQNALTSRIVIEQAKGIIAARLDTGLDQAFDLLRQYARARRKLLADLAREVVEGIADHAVLDQDP